MKTIIHVYCSKQKGIELRKAHPMYERICLTKRWAVHIESADDEVGTAFRFAAKPTRKQIAWARKIYVESM